MRKKIFVFLAIISLLTLNFLAGVKAWALTFDPNYIISDAEMNDYNSMSLQDIQNFLDHQKGILKNYKCYDDQGHLESAAEIIYSLAQKTKINPKVMLVLLQKEQGLLEDPHPTQFQLDEATGYGCPDNSYCNPRWKGFYKQVNSAYLQFRSYMDEDYLYKYRKNGVYIFNLNRNVKTIEIVSPETKATAALYNYTPHIYAGNYIFWKLWHHYFPERAYFPDGSLLREKGKPGIYLIQNGKKRPFLSKAAFLSRYSPKKVVTVSASVLASYPTGKPIRFPNYSLLETPDKTIYLLVNDTLRPLKNYQVFRDIGFNPAEIIKVKQKDIEGYKIGKTITEKDVYPTGALLQNVKTGGVYYVINGEKHPIWSKVILEVDFPNMNIIRVSPKELAKYPTAGPQKLKDGTLIKSKYAPTVYVISDGKKLPIANEKTFLKLGYHWSDIIPVDDRVLEIHPTGHILDIETTSTSPTTA